MTERREYDRSIGERLAIIESAVERMDNDAKELQSDVKELLALANKSRGAVLALISVSATIGGIVAWVVENIFRGAK